jgi:hypothetical protein
VAEGKDHADAVSGGFVAVRCSGVVNGAGDGDDHQVPDVQYEPYACANAAEHATATAPKERALQARLLALEHVLEAVGALLEVGDVRRALNLIRGSLRQD